MTKGEHTPGPWSFCPDMNYVTTSADMAVAYLVWHSTNFDEETNTANAHLIAAAPEMLELLDAIYKTSASYGALLASQRMHIREIIDKAKGGQA